MNSLNRSQYFDNKTQKLIGLFSMFIAFPVVDIPFIGISITFPIFLLICARASMVFKLNLFYIKNNFVDRLLLAFLILAAFSILFTPDSVIGGVSVFLNDFKSFFYLTYWFLVYNFFRNNFFRIKLYFLAKYAFFGQLLCLGIVLLGHTGHGYFSLGPFALSSNTFAFNTVACFGVVSLFLLKKYGLRGFLVYFPLVAFGVLLADSRSGVVILFAQLLLVFLIVNADSNRVIRTRILISSILSIIALLFYSFQSQSELDRGFLAIASAIAPISPEISATLIGGQAQLEHDKSWLIRQVQIEKSLNLAERYPFLGVGWGHFKHVRGEVDMGKYFYLSGDYDDYLLTRSSHNSYAQVLAETGVLGAGCFLMINFYVFWSLLAYLRKNLKRTEIAVIGLSLGGTAIYFWAISAVTGALWYFILGLYVGALTSHKNDRSLRRNKISQPAWC